jgi:UTP--glucose-1-phosphate uridylyltransferase
MLDGINITFMRQLQTRGTGYAVSLARNWVGEDNFILMFPDELNVGPSFVKQLLDAHESTKTCVIPLKEIYIKDCTKYGMIDFTNDEVGCKINGIVEKPAMKNAPSNISYMGGGIFTNEIFEHLNKCQVQPNGEVYLTDAFAGLIKNNQLYGQLIEGERIDFGNPLGFVKGNIIACLNNLEYKDELLTFMKDILGN